MAVFSERIKALRKEKGLSQEDVGKIVGGTKYAAYSYEKERSTPDMKGLIALADYFGVSIDYLVGRTDNPEVNR